MNSSELLQILNKDSHQNHNKKNQLATLRAISEIKSNGSAIKDNQFSDIKLLPSELPVPPQFLIEILDSQLKSKLVNNLIFENIQKQRKQKEKNVYLAYNNSHIAYLSELQTLAKDKNQYISNSITDIMTRRYNIVTGDLQNGKIIINHDRSIVNKEQMEKYSQIDRARLLKIKDGAIRSKIDLLNMKMQEMQIVYQSPKANSQSIEAINKKIQENLNNASYGLQSQKTKIARDYVRYMAQQSKQRRKRQQLRQQRRSQIQKQQQAMLKQAQQMKDISKKQEILQRIQIKRKKREQQEKAHTERQQKISQFLQKHRRQMPIFKKKIKQFQQKFVKPQNAYRQQKLKQIKQKKKSYSLNDIVDHNKKYEELKKKQIQRKLNQKQLQAKSLKINTKQYYRGSAHAFVEQVDKMHRQKQIYLYQLGKNRYDRMMDYSKQVKQEYKPKVDESKKQQILKLLQRQQMKQKKIIKKYKPIINSDGQDIGVQSFYQKIQPKNRYLQGNRFMQQGNLKRKKNISLSIQNKSQQTVKTDQKQQDLKLLRKSQQKSRIKQPENEKQIWRLRSKQMAEMSNKLSSPKQFQQIKVNFQNLDKKAAEKQVVMKHSKMNIQQIMQQKGALDQFYLESIKNKMKLLQ